ncbi:SsrA-binding protein SmpB [Patescibacteria group bacterium]|nr:SsrA-binding protein SmpB [Patescibacteria group bacterium]MBU1721867.1 SsrA-binding protein SmpB [Patescibacteria group bacterium]MBU1901325.1 SsrA-binding protein SmpB [Patescibacteria group bacterium]
MPTLAKNKKAFFDYTILEKFEAGLVLTGQEVKSLRTGNIRLTGAYVTFHKDSPQLTNVHIPLYKYASPKEEYDPERSRALLLKKKEIAYLRGKTQEKGLTIVPLSVYTKGRKIKIEIGIAQGKKQYDKRRAIQKRDQQREDRRMMKEM